MIKHKGDVWREATTPFFRAHVPVNIPEGIPTHTYHGAKIPWDVWRTIVGFCRARGTTDEVLVRLYHNPETGEWAPMVLPQQYPGGMAIKEIADHPSAVAVRSERRAPWVFFGTVHTHCAAAAFQSGTDAADEIGKDGLHITLGHLDRPVLDIHARVTVSVPGELDADGRAVVPATSATYPAKLSEWFDLPEGCSGIPDEFRDAIVTHYLVRVSASAYPPQWDDALVPPPPSRKSRGSTPPVPSWWLGECGDHSPPDGTPSRIREEVEDAVDAYQHACMFIGPLEARVAFEESLDRIKSRWLNQCSMSQLQDVVDSAVRATGVEVPNV